MSYIFLGENKWIWLEYRHWWLAGNCGMRVANYE
jgi:hypothetical protein